VPESKQPRISASLVNGVRRTLLEDGSWPAIEADIQARDPSLLPWLRDAERAEWASLDSYLRFMEILLDRFGSEALALLGRERMQKDLELGPLAPMLRSWVREYADDPAALLRVATHAWQAVTRGAGRMVVVDSGPNRIRFRVEDAPPELLEKRAWHVVLRGFGEQLLALSGRQGSFSVEPLDGSLSLEATWSDG
jgi:hypothetical protein